MAAADTVAVTVEAAGMLREPRPELPWSAQAAASRLRSRSNRVAIVRCFAAIASRLKRHRAAVAAEVANAAAATNYQTLLKVQNRSQKDRFCISRSIVVQPGWKRVMPLIDVIDGPTWGLLAVVILE